MFTEFVQLLAFARSTWHCTTSSVWDDGPLIHHPIPSPSTTTIIIICNQIFITVLLKNSAWLVLYTRTVQSLFALHFVLTYSNCAVRKKKREKRENVNKLLPLCSMRCRRAEKIMWHEEKLCKQGVGINNHKYIPAHATSCNGPRNILRVHVNNIISLYAINFYWFSIVCKSNDFVRANKSKLFSIMVKQT